VEYTEFRAMAAVAPSPRQERGRGVEGDLTDRLRPDDKIQEAGGPGRQAQHARSKHKRHKEEMHQIATPNRKLLLKEV
jgi:hypothetical protein